MAAVDASGEVGKSSAAVQGTTTSATHACHTGGNHHHVAAGRAHQRLGIVYANGSDQHMGLYNVFEMHTLQEKSPDHWVIAASSCPT